MGAVTHVNIKLKNGPHYIAFLKIYVGSRVGCRIFERNLLKISESLVIQLGKFLCCLSIDHLNLNLQRRKNIHPGIVQAGHRRGGGFFRALLYLCLVSTI